MIKANAGFIEAMTSDVAEVYIRLDLLDADNAVIEQIQERISLDSVGSISVDVTRDIRRQFTIPLNNYDGKYTWQKDGLIWIDKKTAKLYIGLKTPVGIEYVPQGVFVLTLPEATHSPTEMGAIINGQDKWYYLSGNYGKFDHIMTYEKGQKIREVIKSIAENAGIKELILDECDAALPYDFTYQIGESRGTAIKELCEKAYSPTDSFFYECFFDVNGFFRFQKKSNPTEIAPCWSYKIEPSTLYGGGKRALDDTTLFNDILVLGGNNEAEFRTQITIDETAYQKELYGDSTKEEFDKGSHNKTEATPIGRLQLLEIKEKKENEEGKKEDAGTGIFEKEGVFTSQWFEIESPYLYHNSNIDWIGVMVNTEKKSEEKKETEPEKAIKQTIEITAEFADGQKKIVGSGKAEQNKPLPYLEKNMALPKYFRYKAKLTSNDNTTTPYITNIKFSIEVNHLPWKGHPYSIQKIGRRLFCYKDGTPDSNIDTQSQCNARAKYEMALNLVYGEAVTLNIAPNYLHEGNDVIEISDVKNGCSGNYQLQSFEIPLRPALITATAKKIYKEELP